MTGPTIEIIRAETVVEVAEVRYELDLGVPGLQGPPGAPGPAGPAGAPGGAPFLYDRGGVAAATWTITHGLGRRVHVTVLDDDGTEVGTDIIQPDLNTVIATFAEPRTGQAVIS